MYVGLSPPLPPPPLPICVILYFPFALCRIVKSFARQACPIVSHLCVCFPSPPQGPPSPPPLNEKSKRRCASKVSCLACACSRFSVFYEKRGRQGKVGTRERDLPTSPCFVQSYYHQEERGRNKEGGGRGTRTVYTEKDRRKRHETKRKAKKDCLYNNIFLEIHRPPSPPLREERE